MVTGHCSHASFPVLGTGPFVSVKNSSMGIPLHAARLIHERSVSTNTGNSAMTLLRPDDERPGWSRRALPTTGVRSGLPLLYLLVEELDVLTDGTGEQNAQLVVLIEGSVHAVTLVGHT
jgi:hypothetical protein